MCRRICGRGSGWCCKPGTHVTDEAQGKNPQTHVFWIIWAALTGGVVFYQAKLGGGWLTGKDAGNAFENPVTYVALAFLFGAGVLRWMVIPRTTMRPRLLVWMIVGLALAEAVAFFSIFLYPRTMPETKMGLLALAFLGMVQFVPVYANRAERSGV